MLAAMNVSTVLLWGIATGAVAIAGAAVTLWRIHRASRTSVPRPAAAIVVFGAGVTADGPSLTVRTRVEHAARLYDAGLAPLIFCSGGCEGALSEARVMRTLLLERGVAAEAVVPDDHGTSTWRALRSARRVGRGRWQRVIAVSSPYHLYRVAQEARRQGLVVETSAARRSGPPTRRQILFDVRQYLREMVAVWAYAVTGASRNRVTASLPARAIRHLRGRLAYAVSGADGVAAASAEMTKAIRARALGSSDVHTVHTPASGLQWPAPGRIGDRFGMRHGRLHAGVDLRAAQGAPVHAAAGGRVVAAEWIGPYGNVVVIDHGGGLATAYAHLGGFVVVEGDPVVGSQVIGLVGDTGRSSGPHLHFEVRVHGSPVDPLVYLRNTDRWDVHRRHGQHNAVWAESIYLRGHDPKNRRRVLTERELAAFARRLELNGIRYAYLFAGPFNDDGSVPDYAWSTTARDSVRALRRLAPGVVWLPWLGGLQHLTVHLENPRWADRAVADTARLMDALDVPGVHLDFEFILPDATYVRQERKLPQTDAGLVEYGIWHVDFHRKMRGTLPAAFLSSVIPSTASPVAPWKRKHDVEEAAALAAEVDQLSLLHYDTSIADRETFVASLVEQLQHVAEWKKRPASARTLYLLGAGTLVNARWLRQYRRRDVEGLPYYLSALDSAIAQTQQSTRLVDGLAVFCDWTTSRLEWQQFRQSWITGAH